MAIDTTALTAGELLTVGFETKAISVERREIEGYAATGHLDLVGDVIEPGAFTRTIREKGPAGVQVFVNHDVSRLPVGALLELREDAQGLFTKARIFRTTAGDDLLQTTKELMALGRSLSMSIGYRILPGGYRHERVGGKAVRKISDLDLVEVSYTTMPANPEARVVGVKQAGAVADPALDEAELTAFFENAATAADLDALLEAAVPLEGPPVDRKRRHIRGYPLTWDNPDASGTRDVVDRDTFGPQLAEGLPALPLFVNHQRTAGEIGRLVAFDVDDVGLLCVFKVHDDDRVPQGTELLEALQRDLEDGIFAGLSAAYKTLHHKTHSDGASRHVTRATLTEVSLLLGCQPAQPLAGISGRRKTVEQYRAELEETQEWLDRKAREDREQQQRDLAYFEQQLYDLASPLERIRMDDRKARRKAYDNLKRQYPGQDWYAHLLEDPPHWSRTFDPAAHARKMREVDLALMRAIDGCETKRIYDHGMRGVWDAHHPGGGDRCPCRAHRLWRKELEAGAPARA